MKGFKETYGGKKILVTGHTGFKGSWLCIWLKLLGAEVIGYALDPATNADNFVVTGLTDKIIDIRGDIRDYTQLQQVFDTYKPEMIFHMAAQALVRPSYIDPVGTYETNVMGTINVLECIRSTSSVKVGVMVTTDKCYENQEQVWGYKEEDALGGYDPYSSSKAAAELAIASWRKSFFNPDQYQCHGKAVASVRAGNVIGGGDWAKDRIIPDCMRALRNNRSIIIRSPKSIRPWQHVLEPLSGYLLLGQKMLEHPTKYCEGWNFGPNLESIVPVWDVAKRVVTLYGKGEVIDGSQVDEPHEAQLLNLDISKAFFKLGWYPTWDIELALKYTIEWYQKFGYQDMYQVCIEEINSFVNSAIWGGQND